MKNAFLLSFLTCLLFWSCKTKTYTLENLPKNQVIFGEGGGFTGQYTHWLLLNNGQLFSKKGFSDGDYVEVGTLKKSLAKKLYKATNDLDIHKMIEQAPGNYNYELSIQKDTVNYTCKWSNPKDVDAAIVNTYKELRLAAHSLKEKQEIKAAEK